MMTGRHTLAVHAECQRIWLVTNELQERGNWKTSVCEFLNWNRHTPLKLIIFRTVRRQWNGFVSQKWGYSKSEHAKRGLLTVYHAEDAF